MNLTCFERGNCAVRRYVFEEKGEKKGNPRSGENGTAGEECFKREEHYWI